MKFTFAPESRPLEGFTIKRAIHRGGFGEVYYALTDAGREVALKLLQNNTDVELRGVQQCLNLSHPNLVTIFDIKQDASGDHWIVMEYVAGETLDQAIRRFPHGMPMEEIRKWLPGIAAGVGYLHDRGLVHRDLKPGNIFSEGGVVKIGDVGLSKFITPSRRSAHTQSVGTVYYMAPEVARGRYGREVDVYALGIILYEMLTGSVPFDGESTGEILMKHLSQPADLSILPPRVRPVIGKAVEKDPAQRYASIAELARAFERAVVGRPEPIDIPEQSFRQPPHASPSRDDVLPASAVLEPTAGPRPSGWRRALVPSERGWWLVLGLGLLLMLGSRRSGNIASVPLMLMGMGLGYVLHTAPRLGRAFELTGNRDGQRRPGRTGPLPPPRRPGPLGGRGQPPVAEARYRRPHAAPLPHRPPPLSPETVRTLSRRTRVAQWCSAAVLAVPFTALLTAGLAVVSPGMFQVAGAPNVDVGAVAFFAVAALLGSWTVLAATRWWIGADVEPGVRRTTLLIAGGLLGFAVWGLGDWMLIPQSGSTLVLDSPHDALFHDVAGYPLTDPSGSPLLLGYIVFFATLLGLRRWWWQTDELRPKRLRVTSVLASVFLAYVLASLFSFPYLWAITWAAVISCVVQLSSKWTLRVDA